MPADPHALLARAFPDREHAYTTRDTMLYALGVGAGMDPGAADLPFVFEKNLAALPTFAVVLGDSGFWLMEEDTGIDWPKVLHGAQDLVIHKPLPAAGTVIGRTRVTGYIDRGVEKGALLFWEKQVIDQASGALLASVTATGVLRGDGGSGVVTGPAPVPEAVPTAPPDATLDLPTPPNIALLYRLSGDFNPLHADPAVARAGGFERPILHGLCSFGIAGRALLRLCCEDDPKRLRRLALRFSAPVYPGETLAFEIWREGNTARFRAKVRERDVVVLNNGMASFV